MAFNESARVKPGTTAHIRSHKSENKRKLKLVPAPEAAHRLPSSGGGHNASHPIRLTYSPDEHSNYFVLDAAWGSLVALLGEHDERMGKPGPCILSAVFDGDGRDDNVANLTDVLIYDIDTAALAEVDALLDAVGIEAVRWTTHNHKSTTNDIGCGAYRRWAVKNGHPETPTDDSFSAFLASSKRTKHYREVKLLNDGRACKVPKRRRIEEVYQFEHAPVDKVRIVIPLAQPLPIKGVNGVGIAGYHRIYLTVGATLFGDSFDTTCKNPSRLHYLASHRPGAEYAVTHYAGSLFDWTPHWTPEVVAAVAEERVQREVKRREWGSSLPADLKLLHHCLKSIPSDLSYDDWFRALGAIHYETKGSDGGRELAHKWSSGDYRYDPEEVDSIWDYFDARTNAKRPATLGTLIKLAREHDDAFISPQRVGVIDLDWMKEFVL